MPQQNLIRLKDVIKRTGLSRTYIYGLMREDKFIKPIKLGTKILSFIESELDAWIDQQIEENRQ